MEKRDYSKITSCFFREHSSLSALVYLLLVRYTHMLTGDVELYLL